MELNEIRKLAGLSLVEAVTPPKVILVSFAEGHGHGSYELVRDLLKFFGFKDYGYVSDLKGAEDRLAEDVLQCAMFAASKPTLDDVEAAFKSRKYVAAD